MSFVLFDAAGASAQDRQHEIPVVAATLLERPIALEDSIGRAHDQVSTSSAEAQRFYDQGLTYLHHFGWIEAARSFNQALRFDAQLAVAYCGLSIAQEQLNQAPAARATLERARTLAPSASEHDRQHVAITALRMAAIAAPADIARAAAYRNALDETVVRFPSDTEFWLERGIAESPDITDRGQGSTAASIRFYNRALAVTPNHFAAEHYLTHAYENSGRIDEALTHGTAYAKAAPGVAHARHMHGHELRRLGRIEDAIAEFETANRIEAQSLTVEGARPEYDWHHEHNLDLLGTSYQYTGRIAKAEEALKAAFALPTANLVQAVNKRQWIVFLRSRGRAAEALAAARTLIAFTNPVVEAVGHIESSHALLMTRQFAEAASEANAALAAMKRAKEGAGLVDVPFEALQGEFFLRTGQREKGRAMLASAIKRARTAQGPDEWAQTLFTIESAARAARDVDDWEFAATMAREMLAHDPSYAGTHYALALTGEHAGDRTAAAREFAEAANDWKNADPDFPELRESRQKASK